MTEEQLLAAAAGGEPGFVALVASPLLIRHVRSAGGTGGRRVTAGVVVDGGGDAAFAVLVEGGGRAAAPTAFGGALACAHAFNDELRRAARDGLTARPAAQETDPAALLRAGAALLG